MVIFPYNERAAAVNEESRKLTEASNRRFLPGINKDEAWAAHKAAAKRFWSAHAVALPEDFLDCVKKLRLHDPSGIERVIEFLEADPFFSGTGYLKACLIRHLLHVPLSDQQIRRLIYVILNIVRQRNTHEFREFCRLAYNLRDHGIVEELHELKQSSDSLVACRANWMTIAIETRRFKQLSAPW